MAGGGRWIEPGCLNEKYGVNVQCAGSLFYLTTGITDKPMNSANDDDDDDDDDDTRSINE